MNAIGVTMTMLSIPCWFVAIYYTNCKFSLKTAWKWMVLGFLLLAITVLITR